MQMLGYTSNDFYLFLLILVRVSGIFIYSPIFSSQNIPMYIKFFLSAVLAAVILSTGIPSTTFVFDAYYPLLLIKELMFGIVFGYISYLFTSVFFTMGQIVDLNMGFGMANVIDPQNRMQVSLFGNFLYIYSLLIFLMMDGHHLLIRAFLHSYEKIQIGMFSFSSSQIDLIADVFSKSFEIGVTLSFPIILIIFVSEVVLGVLSKTIPQLNIFVVGLPLKIILGIAMLLICIPIIFKLTSEVFEYMVDMLFKFINTL